MKNIDLKCLYEESFVDNHVKDFQLNINDKKMHITTNGAYLDSSENNVLCKAQLTISDWYNFKVLKRENGKTKELLEIPKEFLTSILEYHNDGMELKLIGLGYNCWIEWIFLKPKIICLGEVEK